MPMSNMDIEKEGAEMTIEDTLRNCYIEAYPGDSYYTEIPNSPLQAALSAPPVADALMDMRIHDRELYYAFLGDVMRQNQTQKLDEKKLLALNKQVIQSMWKNNLDYFRIINCLTYSPTDKGTAFRYTNAVFLTTQEINPVLSLPNFASAKLIHQLEPLNMLVDKEATYLAHAKAVFMNKPALRIAEVDKEVVRLLVKAEVIDNEIKECLWEGSPQYTHTLDTAIEEKVRLSEQLNKFLDDALQDVKAEPSMSMMDIEPVIHTDDLLYRDMQAKIRNMKSQHEQGDGFAYWETTLKLIQETLNKLNEFQYLSKVVSILSVGMERAAREFDVELHPEFRELQLQAANLVKQIGKRQQDWLFLKETANKTVLLSSQLIQELQKKREGNPLQQMPEVQHAAAFDEVSKEKSVPPDKLYFAALKEIARSYPGILPDDADVLVVQKLEKIQRAPSEIGLALTNSPSFRKLDSAARMTAVRSLMDQASGKHKGGIVR